MAVRRPKILDTALGFNPLVQALTGRQDLPRECPACWPRGAPATWAPILTRIELHRSGRRFHIDKGGHPTLGISSVPGVIKGLELRLFWKAQPLHGAFEIEIQLINENGLPDVCPPYRIHFLSSGCSKTGREGTIWAPLSQWYCRSYGKYSIRVMGMYANRLAEMGSCYIGVERRVGSA